MQVEGWDGHHLLTSFIIYHLLTNREGKDNEILIQRD
jgi:hypothetical protein